MRESDAPRCCRKAPRSRPLRGHPLPHKLALASLPLKMSESGAYSAKVATLALSTEGTSGSRVGYEGRCGLEEGTCPL